MDILKVFDQLSKTDSANSKVAILKQGDSELLRRVLDYALNPFRVYGVKSYFPANHFAGNIPSEEEAFNGFFALLDDLAERKLTGHSAMRQVGISLALGGKYAGLMEKMLLKDLRCGISAKTVNKAFPDLIPTFEVGLAQPFKEAKLRFPVIASRKYDGERCTAFVNGVTGEVDMYTRTGKPIKGYNHVRDELLKFWQTVADNFAGPTTYVFDAELMIEMFGDRKAAEKTAKLVVFDLLTLNEWMNRVNVRTQQERTDKYNTCFMYHNEKVEKLNFVIPEESYIVWDRSFITEFYNRVLSEGGEGLMLKDPKAGYKWGRGWHWQKMKPVLDVDLKITGWFEGEGKFEGTLGGFTVIYKGVEVRVPPGKGVSDSKRGELWAKRETLLGVTLEIQYQEVTPDGSLRHPRFTKVRYDK